MTASCQVLQVSRNATKKRLAANKNIQANKNCMYHVSIDPSLMVDPYDSYDFGQFNVKGPYLEAQGDLYF